MTEPAEPEPTPLERLQAAQQAFADLNRLLPQGVAGFQMPAEAQMAASVDAMARLLLSKGLISEAEFVEAKTLRLAELTEEMVAQVQELKRRSLGVVVPGGGAA